MRRMHLVASAAVLVSFALGSTAVAKPPDVDSSKLRAAVTVDGIVAHQQALQDIADDNGGTRHTKTPGFPASVEYVRETMGTPVGMSRSFSSTCRTGPRRRRRSSSS